MAKVISWILNDKYLYLSGNTSGTVISNTELPSTFVNELAYFWRNKSLAQYTAAFEDLKTKATNTFGLTNLRDAGDYFNVLAQDGVVMISGKDGKNIADSGTPFYNIHLLNENIAVGIGSDSTLDTAASAITQFFIERNGVVRNEDIEQVTVNSTIQGFTYQVIEGEDYWTVILGIPANTQFENSTKTLSTIINVRAKNDYVGKAVFTITGILNGTDGSTYNLVVTPKVINRSASGFFSNDIVTAQCVKDFAPVTSTELMKIQYSWTPEGQKYDYSEPIAVEQIYNNGSTCLFYLLYYNGSGFVTIDSETCIIVQDGTNGTDFTSLELGNEMDGVGLGNDGVVDNGAVLGTSLKLYKGATKSNLISEVKIEGLSDYGHASCDVYNGATLAGSKLFTATGVSFTNLQLNNASFVIRLNNGYSFNEDRREELLVSVVGTIGSDNSVTASGNYVIIGIQGGEDGVVYKVQPSCDTVIYDPNTNAYTETSISCAAFPSTLTIGDKYKLYYSLDEAFNTLSPGMYLYTAPLTGDDIFSQYRKSVVFYLFYESVLLDRETVTFVHQGTDAAERVYLELSNEIDAVALGNDYVLDADVEFTLGLTFYSGESKTKFSTLMIEADDDFDGCECTLFTDVDSAGTIFSGSTAAFTEISNSGDATVVIYVSGGTLDFSDEQKKAIRFTATAAADGREGTGIYTVVGVMDGEDGIVYRVMPEYSSIAYNPENGLYSPTAITCDAYASATKIEFEGEVLTNAWYSIKYTDGSLANPTFENTTALTKSGVVSASITSGVIVFYLFYKSNSWVLLDRETVPIVKDGDKGDAPVWLELSTESATVSCFNNGTVLPDATLPECTATLKRGDTPFINVTYSIASSNTDYTGVSIDSETGEITIDRTLEFTGTTLLLTIRAIAEMTLAEAVFSITKAFSGVAGRTIRRSVWASGVEYYDGNLDDGNGNYYIDYVSNKAVSVGEDTGFTMYKCCVSHKSGDIRLTDDAQSGITYWEDVTDDVTLNMPMILADKISADLIDVEQLWVKELHSEALEVDPEDSGQTTSVTLDIKSNEIILSKGQDGNEKPIFKTHADVLSDYTSGATQVLNFLMLPEGLAFVIYGTGDTFTDSRYGGRVPITRQGNLPGNTRKTYDSTIDIDIYLTLRYNTPTSTVNKGKLRGHLYVEVCTTTMTRMGSVVGPYLYEDKVLYQRGSHGVTGGSDCYFDLGVLPTEAGSASTTFNIGRVQLSDYGELYGNPNSVQFCTCVNVGGYFEAIENIPYGKNYPIKMGCGVEIDIEVTDNNNTRMELYREPSHNQNFVEIASNGIRLANNSDSVTIQLPTGSTDSIQFSVHAGDKGLKVNNNGIYMAFSRNSQGAYNWKQIGTGTTGTFLTVT